MVKTRRYLQPGSRGNYCNLDEAVGNGSNNEAVESALWEASSEPHEKRRHTIGKRRLRNVQINKIATWSTLFA